jgi:hypothetical protein
MGVGSIDIGDEEARYTGDEHWNERGEDRCEKMWCISSRASPMSACDAATLQSWLHEKLSATSVLPQR